MYRAQDRSWLPGPEESVSLALVDGRAPPAFKAHVKTLLMHEEGWKRNPAKVMKTVYEADDKWKLVESVERREGGDNAGGSRRKQSQQQHNRLREGHILALVVTVVTRGIYQEICLLYTSPSPRDLSTSRMPSSA